MQDELYSAPKHMPFNPMAIPEGRAIMLTLANKRRLALGVTGDEYFFSFPDCSSKEGKEKPLRITLSQDGAHAMYDLLATVLGYDNPGYKFSEVIPAEIEACITESGTQPPNETSPSTSTPDGIHG